MRDCLVDNYMSPSDLFRHGLPKEVCTIRLWTGYKSWHKVYNRETDLDIDSLRTSSLGMNKFIDCLLADRENSNALTGKTWESCQQPLADF